MPTLPFIEIESGSTPIASVIWLHGLGADGHDFAPVVPELRLPENMPVRFLFPHAPEMPVTINGGYIMPAWYDILEMNIDRKVDEQQLRTSATWIRELIDHEIARGIPGERIFLFGFSQGGAVAYECALASDVKLGGLVAMSTYFATADTIKRHPANHDLAIQVHHGRYDPIVDFQLGDKACQILREFGHHPEFHPWPIEHSVCLEEIQEISLWLQQQLSAA